MGMTTGYYGYEFDNKGGCDVMNILDSRGYTIGYLPVETGFALLIAANADRETRIQANVRSFDVF
jgi:hypothetical protein